MADLIDRAILQDQDYLRSLKRIDSAVSEMTKDAQKGFDDVAKNARVSGTQIGVVSGVVSGLTNQFINLGRQAVSALENVAKESVNLASDLETTEAIFTGIFEGNEEAAIATLGKIREESRALGVDLQETARAFLPFVQNLEQLSRIGKISAALAISQPEQGALGARVALQEFLSGSALSLVRRFEIPKNLGKELEKALATGGVEQGILKLEEILQRMGRDIDTLGDTFQLSLGKARISAEQLQTAFGVPIVDELKSQLDELNDTITENFDDIELVADAFGRVAANIADIIGGGLNDFLAILDAEQLTRIAEKFFDISEDARLLVETMTGANFPQNFIDGVETFANKLDEALITATQLNLLSEAGAAKARAEYEEWTKEIERLHGQGTLTTEALKQLAGIPGVVQATNELAKLVGDEEAVALSARSAAAGQEAYNKVISDGVAAIDESRKRKEENRQATDAMAEAQKKGVQAGLDEADAFLTAADAARQLADAQEEAGEAQAKINEKLAEAELDFKRKLEDIDIAFERKRLDIALEAAQKRADAARKNLDKIAELERKNKQDITDAATDLDRKEEDIARKFGQERIDLEKEDRQKRLDVELDYQRTLQDIQSQFLLDADEAERKRDAVAFLRAVRERDKKVQEAQQDRSRSIEDARIEGEQRREELRVQQQRELEEANITHERKLEDLRLALSRQLAEQRLNFEHEIEDIAINEQRKLDEANTARERDIEDAKLAYDRKLADLEASLQAEYDKIKEYNALIEAEQQRHLDAMSQMTPAQESRQRRNETISESLQNIREERPGQRARPKFGRRQFGGLVNAGQGYSVGERGPELFIPSANGRIVPNNQLLLPSMQPKTAINNISNIREGAQVTVPDAAGLLNNPVAIRQVRNIVLSILGEVG